MSRQLSFFSAAARAPAVDDVAGILCGPGQLVRRDDVARVSVVLADNWRIESLTAELALRDLPVEVVAVDATDGWPEPTSAGRPSKRLGARADAPPTRQPRSVRTGFVAELEPLAARWSTSGAGKRPPGGLVLDGPILRLWYIVAGRPWEAGQSLGLGVNDLSCWAPVGAALAAAGLPAALVGPRGDGPAYRFTGRRRLERLAELIGEPPSMVEPGAWPV